MFCGKQYPNLVLLLGTYTYDPLIQVTLPSMIYSPLYHSEKSRHALCPGLPYQYKHRATLVWTSKFRPRNDINKTVPESVHVNNWLKKRGLSWEKFQSLVKGKLPIVPLEIASRHRSNMLRGGELDAMINTMDGAHTGIDAGFPRYIFLFCFL